MGRFMGLLGGILDFHVRTEISAVEQNHEPTSNNTATAHTPTQNTARTTTDQEIKESHNQPNQSHVERVHGNFRRS
jgi:hypothetical protein